MAIKIRRTECVEVLITDPSLKEHTFPQTLSVLENAKIVAIETFRNATQPFAPSGRPTANDGAFNRSFLKLRMQDTGADNINQYPLSSLDTRSNNGVMKEFAHLRVNFSQSCIVAGSIGAPFVAGEVILLNVIYEKDEDCPVAKK